MIYTLHSFSALDKGRASMTEPVRDPEDRSERSGDVGQSGSHSDLERGRLSRLGLLVMTASPFLLFVLLLVLDSLLR